MSELIRTEGHLCNVQRPKSLNEFLQRCPVNKTIVDNVIRAWKIINDDKYENILCSISGGSDSDIMLDICWRCDQGNKITYVWFDTGLEYQATKDHLKELEEKYHITIHPYKAQKPIPWTCLHYGQPFLSKRVSDNISRLQHHNFQWENEEYEDLLKKYCTYDSKTGQWRGCSSALKWWCDKWGENSAFNISRNKYLKEFILSHPPAFQISSSCCTYAKKNVYKQYIKKFGAQLNLVGVRKAEGGQRSTSYKNCFDERVGSTDNYRPLFWYTNQDKEDYKNAFGIQYSKCYIEYGLQRTGCAGCPFGRKFEEELEVIHTYEQKLSKAVNHIFKESYEYTRAYRKFIKEMKEKQ